jgi:predicted N-acetyltransferase YhbS
VSTVDIGVLEPRPSAGYESEQDLRYRVLRQPLGMTRSEVTFAGEAAALHVVAAENERVVGCVLFDFASGRLRAMAVDPPLQRSGVGARLVRALEAELRARGVARVALHARADVVGFYERLGYVVTGEPFVEVGIPHRLMAKDLVGE